MFNKTYRFLSVDACQLFLRPIYTFYVCMSPMAFVITFHHLPQSARVQTNALQTSTCNPKMSTCSMHHVYVCSADTDQSVGKQKHELAFNHEKYDISSTIKKVHEDNLISSIHIVVPVNCENQKSTKMVFTQNHMNQLKNFLSAVITILTHKIGISG